MDTIVINETKEEVAFSKGELRSSFRGYEDWSCLIRRKEFEYGKQMSESKYKY
jgi:hypothetical protein